MIFRGAATPELHCLVLASNGMVCVWLYAVLRRLSFFSFLFFRKIPGLCNYPYIVYNIEKRAMIA